MSTIALPKTETIPRRPQLPALTGLRFFAALWVVLHHYDAAWGYTILPAGTLSTPFMNFIAAGHLGVNLFFVLSGFILAYTYAQTDGTVKGGWRSFWQARAARVLPGYWLAFTMSGALLLQAGRLPAAHVGWQALTLTQSWNESAVLWNPPGWSLSVELVFYALFPLLLPLLWQVPTRRVPVASAALWLAGTAPSIWYTVAGSPAAWENALSWSPPPHLPEFAIGVLGCRWFLAGRPVPTLLAPAALISLVAVASTGAMPVIILRGPSTALLFVCLILGQARHPSALLRRPALVYLGEASYALYLVHWPLWQALSLLFPEPSAWQNPALLVTYLLLAVALSCLLFSGFERPVRAAIRELGRRQRMPVAPAPECG